MFKEVDVSVIQAANMVKFRVGWWFKHIGKGSKDPITLILLSIAKRCKDVKKIKLPKVKDWIPPKAETLKFNVDGSVRGSSGQIGVGECCGIVVEKFCVFLLKILGFKTV